MFVWVALTILAAEPESTELRHIFNPTPADQMREFECDRPDRTEGPITVPAGHVQFEVDLATFSVRPQARNEAASSTAGYMTTVAKIGLLDSWDVHLIFAPLSHTIESSPSQKPSVTTGINSFTLRTKINLWGNNGGDTSFGLLPYLTIPTDGRSSPVDLGLILPFGADFIWGTSLGAMVAFGMVSDDAGYVADLSVSASVGRTIYGPLSAYVELFAYAIPQQAHTEGTFDLGFKVAVLENWLIDAGINIPVWGTNEFNPFVGTAVRF